MSKARFWSAWSVVILYLLMWAWSSWLQGQSVRLEWDQPPNGVDGWNVYRSTQSGAGYVRLNPDLIPVMEYTDGTVTPGEEVFYVATAVANDLESGFSNEVPYTYVCRGDPSGDLQRTSLDAVMISQHITGINPLTGYPREAADTNGDGQVTSLDLTLVYQHIVGTYDAGACP
jgi:hypothetical protein